MTIQPRPGQDLARHLEHSDEVHLNDALPFAGIELLEGLIAAEIPGIVHKNVDLRIVINDVREGLCDVIGLGYIDGQGMCAVEFDRIDVPDPDLSAKSYQLRRDRPTNSPRAASHDGGLARDIVLDVHGHL